MSHVLVARQPILDARLHLVGYELLFRQAADAGDGADPRLTNPERATSQVIVDASASSGSIAWSAAGAPT